MPTMVVNDFNSIKVRLEHDMNKPKKVGPAISIP